MDRYVLFQIIMDQMKKKNSLIHFELLKI